MAETITPQFTRNYIVAWSRPSKTGLKLRVSTATLNSQARIVRVDGEEVEGTAVIPRKGKLNVALEWVERIAQAATVLGESVPFEYQILKAGGQFHKSHRGLCKLQEDGTYVATYLV